LTHMWHYKLVETLKLGNKLRLYNLFLHFMKNNLLMKYFVIF